jgi:hypothetical protein
MKYSKLIVALVILLNTVFTGAVLLVFWRTGSEPNTIIMAWFAFTTGELWLLAGIRKKKGSNYDKTAVDQQINEP